jgi:Zn-dependent protease
MDDLSTFIRTATVIAIPLLFAFTMHEVAHAYAARYFGDTTAADAGGLSMNPARHIDLFGTIILPLIMFYTTHMLFGYAKPTPLDYKRLRKPKMHMGLVALAGPMANFVMGVLWMIIGIVLVTFGMQEAFFIEMAKAGVILNASLLVFNLLPLPMFDGGTVLASMLPDALSQKFLELGRYSLFLLIGLILLMQTSFFLPFVQRAVNFAIGIFAFIVSPLTLLF